MEPGCNEGMDESSDIGEIELWAEIGNIFRMKESCTGDVADVDFKEAVVKDGSKVADVGRGG